MKNNANSNCESGTYYNEMIERNRKAKQIDAQAEIDKVNYR
jgi:hypothetical protein